MRKKYIIFFMIILAFSLVIAAEENVTLEGTISKFNHHFTEFKSGEQNYYLIVPPMLELILDKEQNFTVSGSTFSLENREISFPANLFVNKNQQVIFPKSITIDGKEYDLTSLMLNNNSNWMTGFNRRGQQNCWGFDNNYMMNTGYSRGYFMDRRGHFGFNWIGGLFFFAVTVAILIMVILIYYNIRKKHKTKKKKTADVNPDAEEKTEQI